MWVLERIESEPSRSGRELRIPDDPYCDEIVMNLCDLFASFFGSPDTHEWGRPIRASGSTVVTCAKCGYCKFERTKPKGKDRNCDLMVVRSVMEE